MPEVRLERTRKSYSVIETPTIEETQYVTAKRAHESLRVCGRRLGVALYCSAPRTADEEMCPQCKAQQRTGEDTL